MDNQTRDAITRWSRYEIDLHDAVYALGKVVDREDDDGTVLPVEVPADAEAKIRTALAEIEGALAIVEQARPAKAA